MFDPSLRSSRETRATCPLCQQKGALSVTVKDGKPLVNCFYGCSLDSQDELWLLVKGRGLRPDRPVQKAAERGVKKAVRSYAIELWRSSLTGRDGLVPIYLASRGLIGPVPESIRFLPDHMHKPSGTRWPVMLSAVIDVAGKIQGVHRTYLAHDGKGKAAVEPQKMTLGAVGGFAVHLGKVGEKLIIAEGIETAFSVQQSTGIPAWSAISAGGMRQLILPNPPLAREVIIAADNDPVGLQSAQEASARWCCEGRMVRIALPPEGQDFNDVLKEAAL